MTDYIDDTTTLNGVLVAATLLATLGNACWDLDAEPPYHTAFSVMASIAFYSAIIAIWLSLFTLVMGNEKTPYVINYPRWTLASYLFFVLAIASGTVTFFLAGFVVTGSNAIMWPPFAVAVAVILLSVLIGFCCNSRSQLMKPYLAVMDQRSKAKRFLSLAKARGMAIENIQKQVEKIEHCYEGIGAMFGLPVGYDTKDAAFALMGESRATLDGIKLAVDNHINGRVPSAAAETKNQHAEADDDTN